MSRTSISIGNSFSEIDESRRSIEEAQSEVSISSGNNSESGQVSRNILQLAGFENNAGIRNNIQTEDFESIALNNNTPVSYRRSPFVVPELGQTNSFIDNIASGVDFSDLTVAYPSTQQIEETFSNYISTSLETIYGANNDENSIVEDNIIEEILTLSYVVNANLEEETLKNLKNNGPLDISSIIFRDTSNVPSNVFVYYNNITNKRIADIQIISHINPKNKLVTKEIFDDKIRISNQNLIKGYYDKVEIQAKKMFSRIPKVVEFIDNKITDKFRKTRTYLDSIKFGIEKFEDFAKKQNYANIVEKYLNENSTSKHIGKIYKESAFNKDLLNTFRQGINNNITSIQDEDLNLNEFFGKGTTISNITKSSLIISDFKNKNNDILDTDSFIAQQYANLSCSLFTYYPVLFKNNLLIYNITFPTNTQKLESKSPKVCIDVEKNRNKNIYTYINSENMSLDQMSLIKDTMPYTESVNAFEVCIDKSFHTGREIQNIAFERELEQIEEFNSNNFNPIQSNQFDSSNVINDFNYHMFTIENSLGQKTESVDGRTFLEQNNVRKKMSDIIASFIYKNFAFLYKENTVFDFHKRFGNYISYFLENNKESFINDRDNNIDKTVFRFFKNMILEATNNENQSFYDIQIDSLHINNELYKSNNSFLLIEYLLNNETVFNRSYEMIKNNINSKVNSIYDSEHQIDRYSDNVNNRIGRVFYGPESIDANNTDEIKNFINQIVINHFFADESFKNYVFSPQLPVGIKLFYTYIISNGIFSYNELPQEFNRYETLINSLSEEAYSRSDSKYSHLWTRHDSAEVFGSDVERQKVIKRRARDYLASVYILKEILPNSIKFLIEEFNKFNIKLKNMIRNYTRDTYSGINNNFDKSILNILETQSNENFFLTGNKSLDSVLKGKKSIILKELVTKTGNFSNQDDKRKYDFLSKENKSLNSNKILINADSFIKKLKLSYLEKNNINIDLFLNTCKTLKEKSGNPYLVTSSNNSDSNVFIYNEDLLFKELYKSKNDKFYSYYNFFNCKIQNDLNIFNSSFLLNNELEDESYNEKHEKFYSLVKNYYFNNVFKNTSTYLLSNIKNLNNYFNQENLDNNKKDITLQYLYFCCFENEILSNNIEKKSIVKRFLEKSITSLLGINDTSFKFNIDDIVKSDFIEEDGSFNEEKYHKEILDSNEDYKKLVNSIFNFNENVGKSTEVFRLYNLRPLILDIVEENEEDGEINNITAVESFNFDDQLRNEGIAINNFIDIEYYTFPFKKLTREYVATYNKDNNFFKLINIRKRFKTVFDEKGNPLLLIKEKFNHVPIKEKNNNNDLEVSSKYIINSVNTNNYSHNEKILDNFNEICEKEGTLFNLIVKQIKLVIETIKLNDIVSINDIEDVNAFIESNKDLYYFGEKIIENISDIYNIMFRRVELSSYNNAIPVSNTTQQTDTSTGLLGNAFERANINNELIASVAYGVENILEDIEKFGNINKEEKISLLQSKSYDTINAEDYLNKNTLFKEKSDEFLVHKEGDIFSFTTNNFIENQIIKAAISDQLQSFSFDMINGYYLSQKEFYKNNPRESFKNSEFEFLKNELLLGDEIYENISNTSYKRNIYKTISKIMYDNKSLYKDFIKNKTDIFSYYKNNVDKFFTCLKKDNNYINNVIIHLSEEAYNKNILSIGVTNNLIDRIENNIALSVNIDFVNHENSSVSSKEIKFIPLLNNLINNYYGQDESKSSYNGFLSIYNEDNSEIKEKYSILNARGINNIFINDISKNHIDSFSYRNIFNVAYNNNIKEDMFFIDEDYNNRLIDVDFYNLILSLRERDFNLISDISKEKFEENVSIIDEKYAKIPDLSFCINNNINIYNTLYEINKNISNIEFDKMFKEKLFYEIYFIPIDRESNDGITLYPKFDLVKIKP